MARILLISPDATKRLVIEPALYADGHYIRMVESAGDAIDLLGEENFDVVICDTQLPDLQSRVMMRHIKEVYGLPTIVLGDHSQFRHHWLSLRPREMHTQVDCQSLMRMVHRYV